MARPEDPTARDRLLHAATTLFYDRGIPAVGVAEVVAEAGTGKNVLYRHFPDGKDELVLAYLHSFAERIEAGMDQALAEVPPEEGLVTLARYVASLVTHRRYRGCPFRNYLREMRDPSDAPGRFAMTQVRGLRRRVDALVAEVDAEEPEVLADRIWLVIEGLYASAPYGDRTEAATTSVGLVQELLAAA